MFSIKSLFLCTLFVPSLLVGAQRLAIERLFSKPLSEEGATKVAAAIGITGAGVVGGTLGSQVGIILAGLRDRHHTVRTDNEIRIRHNIAFAGAYGGFVMGIFIRMNRLGIGTSVRGGTLLVSGLLVAGRAYARDSRKSIL